MYNKVFIYNINNYVIDVIYFFFICYKKYYVK